MVELINDYSYVPETSELVVIEVLRKYGIPDSVQTKFLENCVDGISFCLISEADLHEMEIKQIGLRKKLLYLSTLWRKRIEKQGLFDTNCIYEYSTSNQCENSQSSIYCRYTSLNCKKSSSNLITLLVDENEQTVVENNLCSWKVVISFLYFFLATAITSCVMVLAHERLPDMSKYPPLPDLFLDNLPYISWGFAAAEFVGIILSVIWLFILIFHKYRLILLRRFFAIFGTVFFLRCITMLITSLSVPGKHLTDHCSPFIIENSYKRLERIFTIYINIGLSISGVQTCGDYMFSGHTSCLTLLNFFITEYSPRKLQNLHTFCWVLNLFGIFFILASHEHYSIDVFVAVYVSSRLFLYYHCLANSNIFRQKDKERTMIWFPLFSFLEYEITSIVPNVYENPFRNLYSYLNSKIKKKFSSTSTGYDKKKDFDFNKLNSNHNIVSYTKLNGSSISLGDNDFDS